MSDFTIDMRIINKHDTEENWGKVPNFIPNPGELIVYDKDRNHIHPRLKVGDGSTKIKDLPFISSNTNSEERTFIYVGEDDPGVDSGLMWIDTSEHDRFYFKVPYDGNWSIVETPNVLKFTEQELTESEKERARKNIGAAEEGSGVVDHSELYNRDLENQHPISAITNLQLTLDNKQPIGDYALKSEIPTVPITSVNGKTGEVVLTADDVGADKNGTASSEISKHNTENDAHNDIRLLITALAARMDTLANSDDETLDQMAEIVAYIKNNKDLIDGVTTNKINKTDIVDNLNTNATDKVLSSAQGVALKALIDAITIPTKVSELTNDKGYLTAIPNEYVTETELTEKKYLTSIPSEYVTETELTAKGYITSYTETDPTVPAWAKADSKPSYSKSEIGLGNVDNVKQYSVNNPPPYPVTSVNGMTGEVNISIPTVPTKVSAFSNDSGYLTQIPNEYITETELASEVKKLATKEYVDSAIESAGSAFTYEVVLF